MWEKEQKLTSFLRKNVYTLSKKEFFFMYLYFMHVIHRKTVRLVSGRAKNFGYG